jgi:hypothetical protein
MQSLKSIYKIVFVFAICWQVNMAFPQDDAAGTQDKPIQSTGNSLSATAVREYPCYRLVSEPVIDGKLNDEVWNTIPPCQGFLIHGKGYARTERQTLFKIGWTDKALFVAVSCSEPDPARLLADKADGDQVYSDDSVELFLFPAHQASYKQLAVNAKGNRWNGEGMFGGRKLWSWTAKAVIGEQDWTCEARIPFELFKTIPGNEEIWRFNIARNSFTSEANERYTCWVRLSSLGFHDVDNFGALVFKEKVLSQGEAAVLGRHLRLEPYIQKQIRELVKVRAEYKEVIEQGMQFKELQKEIQEIQQGWTRAEEMATKEEPSLQAVYDCWEQSRMLAERTRKLPLRVAMEKLFVE